MKGGKYTLTLAKIWVEEIIRIRNIRGNGLPKFIELCINHPDELQLMADGNQQKHLLPTDVTDRCYRYKSVNLLLEELINIKVILFLILELF